MFYLTPLRQNAAAVLGRPHTGLVTRYTSSKLYLSTLIPVEKVLHAGLRFFTHSGSCNLLYALFIFKQVTYLLYVVACVYSLYRMQLYVFVCSSLAILKLLSL